MNRRKCRMHLLALAVMLSMPASAWDGTVSGQINQIDVTAAEGQALRVYIAGVSSMCGNSVSWAYLNESDSNYKVYVAAALAAKAAGDPVIIYTTRDAAGYCKLGYFVVRSN